MASPARVPENQTLDEFLRLPEEKPALEYVDGRIEAKVSPQLRHALITAFLTQRINQFAAPRGLGVAVPELRCTFVGRSIVPGVVHLLEDHVPVDVRGRVQDQVHRAPDLHVEIISPDQSAKKSQEKLVHSTSNGCLLGWLVDPEREWVEVFQPGSAPERLSTGGLLDGGVVLPGFRLPVTELFACLDRPRGPQPDAPPTVRDDLG